MVFSSLTFLFAFFPLVIIVYFINSNVTYRNLVLLLSSIVFYAWGEPVYVILMFISTLNDYLHALLISKMKAKGNQTGSKLALISSITINLGLLSFYKYSDFIIMNINRVFNTNIDLLNIALPIGISFYTFQTMSYTLDVYLGKVKAQKNLLILSTYVTMFPQLVAGPIVRYSTIERELAVRKESWDDAAEGLKRFIIGLGKKVIIANQMGLMADTVFNLDKSNIGMSLAWAGIIAYTFQIYFDFSGYSDMAIGMGRLFGFRYLENFNYPYISQSITEFWRRWHISLGSFFRDYVYIPLGGNRVNIQRWIINILVVWFLTGLWHGASWNFVLWGLYFALILMAEKFILLRVLNRCPRIIRHMYTIFLIIIGWVIFRSESLIQIMEYLAALFGLYSNNELKDFYNLSLLHLIPYMFIAIIASTPLPNLILKKLNEKLLSGLVYDAFLFTVFLISIMYLVNNTFNPFIYFRF